MAMAAFVQELSVEDILKAKKRKYPDDFDNLRMLQLMLGPVERRGTTMHTRDLLGGGGRSRHGELHDSFDLDSDTPLPSGWEKCLDLKTGSMYYLNRSTGLSTSCDPRKPTSGNWPTSPSSSDLTVEATLGKGSTTIASPNKPSECADKFDSNHLDLSLSLKPSSRSSTAVGEAQGRHEQRREGHYNIGRLFCQPQSNHNNHGLPNSTNYPTCSSSATSSPSTSSRSALSFQEINGVKSGAARCKLGSSNLSHEVESTVKKPISSNFAANPMITVGCANCLMFVMLPKTCNPKCPRCGVSLESDLPQPSSKTTRLGLSLMY